MRFFHEKGFFSETLGKNVFRLTAILCLFFAFSPNNLLKPQKVPAAEHGIGGGIIKLKSDELNDELEFNFDEIISGEEAAMIPSEPLEVFSMTHALLYTSHIVKKGENVSELAVNFGLNQDTIISINKITNSRLLQIGKKLRVPNQDGVLHTVRDGDSIASLSERYKTNINAIILSNELFSETIRTGSDLFIPGAKLDWVSLQEINGDLFLWPVNGAITSPYGYRIDPFSNRRQFHTGIDIRGSTGTPIRAALAGRVSQVGYDSVLGNFVAISHHSGYRTVYAHMSVIRTRTGAYVAAGERIGDVGSTGLSTGPHLHFTVYKNGVLVNPRSLMR